MELVKKISTQVGEISLLDPTPELITSIRKMLPFGLVRFSEPVNDALYGIVMKCDESEIYGLKQQPVDCSNDRGMIEFQANSILITHCLPQFLKNGFRGLFMPCAYFKKKSNDSVESGVAYFGVPAEKDAPLETDESLSAFDSQFGCGFTCMVTKFIEAFRESSHTIGISSMQPIGLDVRTRLQIGTIGFSFMLLDRDIICLKTKIHGERDPIWRVLRSVGISKVYHLPSAPTQISEEELAISKPQST